MPTTPSALQPSPDAATDPAPQDRLFTLGPMNERQARTVADALELYTRILMGQLGEVTDLARFGLLTDKNGEQVSIERVEQAETLMTEAKVLLTGLPPNAHKGIGGPHTPRTAQHAYELRKVIRHRLALLRNPQGTSLQGVDFDDPFLVRYDNEVPRAQLADFVPKEDSPPAKPTRRKAVR